MYSDTAVVASVPAGAAGLALYAPMQAALGAAILASLALVVAVLLAMRSSRLAHQH